MKTYHIRDFVDSPKEWPIWILHEEKRGYAEEPHQHDCTEIMYIEKGAGCCIINRTRYPVLRGDFFLLRPGDVHEFIPTVPFAYYNLLFSDEIFTLEEKEILRSHPWLMERQTGEDPRPEKINIPVAQTVKVESMLSDLLEECEHHRGPESNLLRKALFLRLLIFVLRESAASPLITGDKHEQQLSLLFDYIARNYAKKLSIAELAKASGVSPNYFNEFLRKNIGQNLTGYLLRYRVEQAKIALKNPENTISWVACCCGFYDASHFTRVFREFTGMTPGEYRKSKKG